MKITKKQLEEIIKEELAMMEDDFKGPYQAGAGEEQAPTPKELQKKKNYWGRISMVPMYAKEMGVSDADLAFIETTVQALGAFAGGGDWELPKTTIEQGLAMLKQAIAARESAGVE